jgi:hypothetical protein
MLDSEVECKYESAFDIDKANQDVIDSLRKLRKSPDLKLLPIQDQGFLTHLTKSTSHPNLTNKFDQDSSLEQEKPEAHFLDLKLQNQQKIVQMVNTLGSMNKQNQETMLEIHHE